MRLCAGELRPCGMAATLLHCAQHRSAAGRHILPCRRRPMHDDATDVSPPPAARTGSGPSSATAPGEQPPALAAPGSTPAAGSGPPPITLRRSLLYSSGNFGAGLYYGLNSFILPILLISLRV